VKFVEQGYALGIKDVNSPAQWPSAGRHQNALFLADRERGAWDEPCPGSEDGAVFPHSGQNPGLCRRRSPEAAWRVEAESSALFNKLSIGVALANKRIDSTLEADYIV